MFEKPLVLFEKPLLVFWVGEPLVAILRRTPLLAESLLFLICSVSGLIESFPGPFSSRLGVPPRLCRGVTVSASPGGGVGCAWEDGPVGSFGHLLPSCVHPPQGFGSPVQGPVDSGFSRLSIHGPPLCSGSGCRNCGRGPQCKCHPTGLVFRLYVALSLLSAWVICL